MKEFDVIVMIERCSEGLANESCEESRVLHSGE